MMSNAAHLFKGQAITVISRSLYIIVIAKYLGSELYGLLVYSQSWYLLFIPGIQLGLGSILSRQVGLNQIKGKEIASEILSIRLIALILLTLTCMFVGLALNDDTTTKILVVIMSISLIGRSLATHSLHVFVAFEQSKYSFQLDFWFRTLEVFCAVVSAYIFRNVFVVACIHAFFWLMQGLVGIYIVRKQICSINLTLKWRRFYVLLISALPIAFSDFIFGAMLQWPILAIKETSTVESEIGNMALLCQGVFVLLTIAYALGGAALPVLSRAANVDNGKVKKFVSIVFRSIVISATLMMIVGEYMSQTIINYVFDNGYNIAAQNTRYIFYLFVPMSLFIIYRSVLLAFGKTTELLLLNAIALISLVLLTYLFTSKTSIETILVAMIFSFSMGILYLLFLFRAMKLVNIGRDILPPLLLSAPLIMIFNYMGYSNFLSIVSSALTLCLLTVFIIVNKGERKYLVSLVIKDRNT